MELLDVTSHLLNICQSIDSEKFSNQEHSESVKNEHTEDPSSRDDLPKQSTDHGDSKIIIEQFTDKVKHRDGLAKSCLVMEFSDVKSHNLDVSHLINSENFSNQTYDSNSVKREPTEDPYSGNNLLNQLSDIEDTKNFVEQFTDENGKIWPREDLAKLWNSHSVKLEMNADSNVKIESEDILPKLEGENELNQQELHRDGIPENEEFSQPSYSPKCTWCHVDRNGNEQSASNLRSEYLPSDSSDYSIKFESDETLDDSQEPNFSPSLKAARPLINVESPSEEESVKSILEETEKISRERRKHLCPFCYLNVGNFSRHLERNHGEEVEVMKFINLKKNSKDRKKLIDKIRREGDFQSDHIIPVMEMKMKPENHIVCIFCKGYYSSKTLRRHTKKCHFNLNPTKKLNSQNRGHTLMSGHFGPDDPLKASGLLDMMKADNTSTVAKRDQLICEVGRKYIKSHKQIHLLQVAKRNMRRLSRLLQCVREEEKNSNLNLIDILRAQNFQKLVRATKNIAGYNVAERTFKSPSLASQMGTLIKFAVSTALSNKIQKNTVQWEKLQSLRSLVETDWACEMFSKAGQNLTISKSNKPTIISAAEDIKKFEIYLKKLIYNSKSALVTDPKHKPAFKSLLEGIFCSLLLFNRRRVGELQRLTLSSFKNHSKITSTEFEKVLTNTEKILMSLKRVVIREKHGRGVLVLFNKQHVESVEFLLSIRDHFNLQDSKYLFGIPGTTNPMNGYLTMRKHTKVALGNSKKANLLTSIKLRQHLATITQIFNMEKTELKQLANFMGHTEKTHEEFYKLPDDICKTGKISKLLISQEEGSEMYKYKSLEEIELGEALLEQDNIEETVPMENIEENETFGMDEFVRLQPIKAPTSKKNRTLTAWTENQKKTTKSFFSNHITKSKAPRKREVEKMIQTSPDIFENKTWRQIKAFVYNESTK